MMKSSLLAFHPLTGQHTRRRIAEVVFNLLQHVGINSGDVCIKFYVFFFGEINYNQESHWMLDMASNNNIFI